MTKDIFLGLNSNGVEVNVNLSHYPWIIKSRRLMPTARTRVSRIGLKINRLIDNFFIGTAPFSIITIGETFNFCSVMLSEWIILKYIYRCINKYRPSDAFLIKWIIFGQITWQSWKKTAMPDLEEIFNADKLRNIFIINNILIESNINLPGFPENILFVQIRKLLFQILSDDIVKTGKHGVKTGQHDIFRTSY